MPDQPRLSLCIPTWNRAPFLREALASLIREARSLPSGLVEVLVSDNGSTDETPAVIADLKTEWPELRAFRNDPNQGYDPNYLRCVEEARGEFVWVIGDDDVLISGSVPRMLQELDLGADICLCLAETCDWEMNPLVVLPWYLDPDPPRVWHLETREDRLRYFNACARNAGVFAFISVTVFRRERYLAHRESFQRGLQSGYVHVWGMIAFICQPSVVRYLPQALVRNRLSDLHTGSLASTDLYSRLMNDLRVWCSVADLLLEDDEIRDAFVRIAGRNQHDSLLPNLRRHATREVDWQAAVPFLNRAGFSPTRVAATDLGFKLFQGTLQPAPSLEASSLCLADLPLVVRGARLTVVLALGDLQSLVGGTSLLAALRSQKGTAQVRVFCPPEAASLLDGFGVQPVDLKAYRAHEAYRMQLAETLSGQPLDLIVNLDPDRGVEGDDLCALLQPPGVIGFTLPDRAQDTELAKALNQAYTCLITPKAGPEGMRVALGLPEGSTKLWPVGSAQEEARGLFTQLGWDPVRTLALLVDHPDIAMDPAFQKGLAKAVDEGWTLVGIGGRSSRAALSALCEPLEGRAVSLAGVLGLGTMAALMQRCGAFLGGTPLLQGMAKACGCAPYGDEG